MSEIKIGSSKNFIIKVGSTNVSKVYVGSNLVYPSGPAPTPTPTPNPVPVFSSVNGAVLGGSYGSSGSLYYFGGNFTSYGTATGYKGIIRTFSNGDLDVAWVNAIVNSGTGPAGGGVKFVKALSDGKALVGGHFTSWNGNSSYKGLVRVNQNGSIDNTFTPSFSTLQQIDYIEQDSSNNILLGTYQSNGNTAIVKLNTLGQVLNIGDLGNQVTSIRSIKIQSDGKILYGTTEKIGRLNSDLSIDSSFTTSMNGDAFTILSTGKIMAGEFTTLRRLNSDGTVDNTFTPVGYTAAIRDAATKSDGSYVVAIGTSDGIFIDEYDNSIRYGSNFITTTA
jgi:hypothetical protein